MNLTEEHLLNQEKWNRSWNIFVEYKDVSFAYSELVRQYQSLVKDDPPLLALQTVRETISAPHDFPTIEREMSKATDLWNQKLNSYNQSDNQATPELQSFWKRS